MSEKLRVLVVCDGAEAMQSLRNTLRHYAKLDCSFANTGSEALPLVTTGTPFDIIISDIDDSGVSTIDLQRVAVARDENTRVVVISSFGEHQEVIEAIRAGAYGYLHKPYRVEELHLMLNNLIAHFNETRAVTASKQTIRDLEASGEQLALREKELEGEVADLRTELVRHKPGESGHQTDLEQAMAEATRQKTGEHHGYKVFKELENLDMLRREKRITEDEYQEFRKIVLDKAYQQQNG